jgi:outer membrane protein TolC
MKQKIYIILLFCIIATPPSIVSCEDKKLNIRDVITHALENNLQLKVDRVSKHIQKDKVDAANTIFDPSIEAEASIASNSTKTDHYIFRSDTEKVDASIAKLMQNGDILSVNMVSKRQKTKPFLPATPATKTDFSHQLALSYIKPLMKGKGKDVVTTEIQVEKNNLTFEQLLFEQHMINTMTTAQIYYWELFKSKEQLQAQIKSLELAKTFLKTTQEKLDMGLIANSELLQAKAEVAAREEAVLISENEVKNNQDQLVQYIFGTIELDDENVLLDQKPVFEKMKDIQIKPQIQKALDYRIDFQLGKIALENANLNYNYYKNQIRPKIDLNILFSIDGDGKSNNIAYDQFFSGDNYSGQIGVSVEYPWKMRRDKANLSKSSHERYQAKLSLANIKQKIILEVREALRNVLSLEKRFASTKVAQNLAEEKLKMEEDRFRSGYSTSYNVLQFQRDLTDAMVKNINAIVDYQIARVYLEQSTGVTLEVHQVKINSLL